MTRIYLDYNASTPIAPSVAEAMQAAMGDAYGNPASGHWAGVPAQRLLAEGRARVAELIGAQPGEIVFTSGGSESNNHALKGVFHASRRGSPTPSRPPSSTRRWMPRAASSSAWAHGSPGWAWTRRGESIPATCSVR